MNGNVSVEKASSVDRDEEDEKHHWHDERELHEALAVVMRPVPIVRTMASPNLVRTSRRVLQCQLATYLAVPTLPGCERIR